MSRDACSRSPAGCWLIRSGNARLCNSMLRLPDDVALFFRKHKELHAEAANRGGGAASGPLLSEQETPERKSPEPGQVSDFHEKLNSRQNYFSKLRGSCPIFSAYRVCEGGRFRAIFTLVAAVGIAFAALLWRLPVLLLLLVIGVALIALVIFLFARGGLYWITSRFDQLYLRKGSLTELLRARRR